LASAVASWIGGGVGRDGMGGGFTATRRPEEIRSEGDAESGPNLLGRLPPGPRDPDMGWRHYLPSHPRQQLIVRPRARRHPLLLVIAAVPAEEHEAVVEEG
jgi:hypothetical protein